MWLPLSKSLQAHHLNLHLRSAIAIAMQTATLELEKSLRMLLLTFLLQLYLMTYKLSNFKQMQIFQNIIIKIIPIKQQLLQVYKILLGDFILHILYITIIHLLMILKV